MMVLDSVVINIKQPEMGNLINIPIESLKSSGILKEISNNAQRISSTTIQEPGKGDRRRCKGKENAGTVNAGN